MKKNSSVRQNFILLAVSLFFTLAFAEVVLRMFLPAPINWKFPQEAYLFDPEIGHWLEPNQQAFTHDRVVRTNSAGIRDSEYSSMAPSGVYRILALGDSQTFGNGLDLEDTWPKQLEKALNMNGEKYEVINCGIPGTDTWQHELILERMVAKYNPDAVVLAFYVNDVVKRFIPTRAAHKQGSALFSRFVYLVKKSLLFLSLRNAYQTMKQRISPTPQSAQQLALLNGKNGPEIEGRWAQVEESLTSMKRQADRNKVDLLVASLPRRDQVDGRLPWVYYKNRLSQIADNHNIPFISMLEPLQTAYVEKGKDLFIPWDGHNSKYSNYIIAEQIAYIMMSR